MAATSTSSQQSRYWCFTLNNPQPEEDPNSWGGSFCIWQLERGEEGTLHYQGYIVFKNNKRFVALKAINPRAHWEPRRGTHEQAVHYSTKPHLGCSCVHCAKCTPESRVDGPWTHGEIPKQGKRSDLLLLKERLDTGVSVKDIWADPETFPIVSKYDRVPSLYRLATVPQRRFKTHVLVLYGPPGLGKSYFPATVYPDAYYKNNTEWWDGYEHQKVVVLDDFHSSWFPFTFLLQLLDRYPLNVQVKGGTIPFNSKLIIITTNRSPRSWYRPEHHPYSALERRLTTIYRFQKEGYPVLEKGKPIKFDWSRCFEILPDEDFNYDEDIDEIHSREPPPFETIHPSSVVFDDNEYLDYEDGERVLRPSYPINPAAPKRFRS